jgi:hypothetical protein
MTLKRKTREILAKLPFGVGEDYLLPLMGFLLYLRPLRDWRRKRAAKLEAEIIRNAIKQKVREAALVYDNLVSPPTYGDLLYVLMVGRFFMASGLKLRFYIITSEYREDWAPLVDGNRVDWFLAEQMMLARRVLDIGEPIILSVSWEDYRKASNDLEKSSYVLFSERVKARAACYQDCCNLLSFLLHSSDREVANRTLLSSRPLEETWSYTLVSQAQGYIAWPCRYNIAWGVNRNLANAEFVQIGKLLRREFPAKTILILSDEAGCRYYKRLAAEFGFDFLFSKDMSPNFVGDLELVLNSDLLVQCRGGGIGSVAVLSDTPYLMIVPLVHETMWSRKKLCSWMTDRQILINASDLPVNRHLIHYLHRVAS